MEGFDVNTVLDGVRERVDARYAEVVARLLAEQDAAMEAALAYARHLANGGAPSVYPGVPYSSVANQPLIAVSFALVRVYHAWNAARGSTNPVVPIQNIPGWKVAEHLHSHVGEAVLFETLAEEGRVRSKRDDREFITKKLTPDEVANAVMRAQTDSLIARKTKLGTKVAYVLREKREGEEAAASTWNFPVEEAVAVS